MWNLSNFVIPPYAKYIALVVFVIALWGHGYVKGLQHAVEEAPQQAFDSVVVLNKVTERVVTKYIKQKEKQRKVDEEIKHEGNSFPIKYPDAGFANNEFVWLYDASVKGAFPPLPSGELGDSSGVPYSEVLSTSQHNHTVGREWKERALACEQWTKEVEQEYNK